MKRLILSALLTAPLLSLAATGNLISNGSFESTAQSSGSWNIYNSIAGWTAGSLGVEVRNNVAGTALDRSERRRKIECLSANLGKCRRKPLVARKKTSQ